MKTIGIITSNTSFRNNYGAVLQSYALCEQLKKWGYDPKVINYTYSGGKNMIAMNTTQKRTAGSVFRYLCSGEVSLLQKIHYRLSRGKRQQMEQRFVEFHQRYILLHSDTPVNYGSLCADPLDFDFYITGSDQVWNPVIHGNDNDPGCFLQFAPEKEKRIAYAPSFGIGDYPQELAASLKTYIGSMGWLSVREPEGQRILRKYAAVEVPLVLDPTLMADEDVFDPISAEVQGLPKEYILCYRFGKESYWEETVRQLSKVLKLPVVELPLSIEAYAKGTRLRYDIDPAKFIGAIRGAKLVVTDSFHCTVFAVLNHVPFYTLMRQSRDAKHNMNGRMVHLLEMLGLQNRMVNAQSKLEFDRESVLKVEFTHADAILAREREKSQKYLKTALES